MLTPFAILYSPGATLARIKSKPEWLAPFLMLAAISIVLYVLTHPFLIEATLAHLPASANAGDKAAVAQTLHSELPLRSSFLPIRLLIGWSSFACTLFLIGRTVRSPEQLHFVKVFSLCVHAEMIGVLSQLATLIGLTLRGSVFLKMPALVPFSAAYLISTKDSVTFSLLNSINFFTLLYVLVLTKGISVQSGMSRRKSLIVVLLAFLGLLLFDAGAVALLRNTLHFGL
ncbi:MAG: YIP1 family protein [Bacteroidetes bacterium]|nr:YIP1 family protein [Bacteroidota bacterium]MCW5897293.1 YIP1 family protein [Bacteroidota bacterium]